MRSAPTDHPSAKGVTTPSTATVTDGKPTLTMSRTVDSSPTWNRRIKTPSCASTSMVALEANPWNHGTPSSWRLPSNTPATSSPSTGGWPARVAKSPPSLALATITASARMTGAAASAPGAGAPTASQEIGTAATDSVVRDRGGGKPILGARGAGLVSADGHDGQGQ